MLSDVSKALATLSGQIESSEEDREKSIVSMISIVSLKATEKGLDGERIEGLLKGVISLFKMDLDGAKDLIEQLGLVDMDKMKTVIDVFNKQCKGFSKKKKQLEAGVEVIAAEASPAVLFQKFDINNDKELDFHEFKQLCRFMHLV